VNYKESDDIIQTRLNTFEFPCGETLNLTGMKVGKVGGGEGRKKKRSARAMVMGAEKPRRMKNGKLWSFIHAKLIDERLPEAGR